MYGAYMDLCSFALPETIMEVEYSLFGEENNLPHHHVPRHHVCWMEGI